MTDRPAPRPTTTPTPTPATQGRSARPVRGTHLRHRQAVRDRARPGERGQVAPLALVAVLFAALLAVGVAQVGAAAGRRAGAQAAADATALAGAAAGEEAAAEVAAANDARVVRFEQVGDDVRITVERGGATASARARWEPAPIP